VTEETINLPVRLPNGAMIHIEATRFAAQGEVDVVDVRELVEKDVLDPLTQALEGIAEWVDASLKKIGPKKASVEFGMEVGFAAGQLTALLAKGSTKANLKIKLEWENSQTEVGKSGQSA
jgi:hypothetical protein